MHDWTAPHSTTHPTTPPHANPAHGDWPHSPNALAAAVTLATLSDNRPPGDDEDDIDDDDDGGGISLEDYQHYMEAMPESHQAGANSDDEDPSLDEGGTIEDMFGFGPVHPSYVTYTALDMFPGSSIPQHHTSTTHFIAPVTIVGNLPYGTDLLLEPPPTLNEPHLSIQDRAAFCPITSYFHRFYGQWKPGVVPGLDLVQVPEFITREDLKGDEYDYQGIDWTARKTTRAAVRRARSQHERQRVPHSVKQVRKHVRSTPNTESFFQFRRINTSPRAFVPHFQLRNVLTATSRNDVYYAKGHQVLHTDAEGTSEDAVVDLSKHLALDASITTIASQGDVLIAGAFEGEYAITDLSSTHGSPCTFGRTTDFATDTKSRIVNHMHLFPSRRTYTPQAVLCSNDHRLRVLDCGTNSFIHSFLYPAAVNCSATSPNGRMRVVVGDFQETLITNAETGQPFETLNSHTDDAFACAWADDGIHVATAAQDSTIVVWDARYWEKPLAVMKSELSVPRSLHFSPIGSGPRVLVATEADDFINIINAQTWESKQTFDFFGPAGGVSFTPDGQSLFVANGERRFGGIIELERTGWADKTGRRGSFDDETRDEIVVDWAGEEALDNDGRVLAGDVARRRRHVDLSDVIV
ncbi:WD40-repeat-containing domain protein [Alternaria rosae]|uniref:WD40-repeat-containing domain protein n=1 Tax=Alternaria rosae TaxID=1187941 RepID=UPI001E8EA979|nr:WD40-repeat-containing domain protein [Alternaria rosae]KAH6879096.1 WD40-repeat-containing domain protein [Alternaria rosae]